MFGLHIPKSCLATYLSTCLWYMYKIAGCVKKKSYLQVLALVSSKTNAEENGNHSNLTKKK